MLHHRRIRRPLAIGVVFWPIVAITAAGWQFAPAVVESAEQPPAIDSPATASQTDPDDRPRQNLIRSKGAFAKLWNEQQFIGPGTLTTPGDANAMDARLPGDFEPHAAILLAGGWLAREAPDVLTETVRQAGVRARLIVLVTSSDERELTVRVLAQRGLRLEADQFLTVATDTGWVRDFGPVFSIGATGTLQALDSAYDKPGRPQDDAAARAIADGFRSTTTDTQLRWQGGNLLSNGEGLLVTTTQSINANIESGHDVDTTTSFLARRFGLNRIVVLEHLVGETTGHVDMFACFTSPDTILVGSCDESVDPANAALLDRNAARLAAVASGEHQLKVIRIPMPDRQDGLWRSFTNVVFADGFVLVPIYPGVDPAGGEAAQALFRRHLPSHKVIGINASQLARHQGGLRCLTLYVPHS